MVNRNDYEYKRTQIVHFLELKVRELRMTSTFQFFKLILLRMMINIFTLRRDEIPSEESSSL